MRKVHGSLLVHRKFVGFVCMIITHNGALALYLTLQHSNSTSSDYASEVNLLVPPVAPLG
jgi:hypothetical protein